MTILGVDFSENQLPNLPFPAWFAQGLRIAIGRVSIGYRRDAQYPRHLEQARAAGFECRGGYGVILHHDREVPFFDPVRQANVFVDALIPGLTTVSVLDLELAGGLNLPLTEPMVRAWCDRYDARCRLPLWIYGNTWIQRLLGSNPARYLKYFKWVSDYGFFAPGTNAPPLRSEPYQVAGLPRMPAVAGPMVLLQFAGDNGRRPPYPRPIDLNVFEGTEAELKALFGLSAPAQPPAVIRARGKVGPQLNVQGDSDATDWLLRGEPSAAVGINIGPPGEIAGRDLFFAGRNFEDAWNPENPQRDGYSGQPIPDARKYADLWYKDWLPLNPWARLVATPNEPVVLTVPVMEYCAAFLAELTRILHVEFGRVAVVGNWSVGSPDFPLWAAYRPALEAVARYGAVLGRHSYGPLNDFYALRHRRDNAIFAAMGFPDLPVLITECGWENLPEVLPDGSGRTWASEPRRSALEYADYLLLLDLELMKDRYVLGASVFTYGVNWSQHNINGSGVGRIMADALAPRPVFELAWPTPRPVPPEGDDELSSSQKERIEAELVKAETAHAAIRNVLAETPEPPAWWELWPEGVISPARNLQPPNKVLTFYHRDSTPFVPSPLRPERPVTWIMQATERVGRLLRVVDQTGTVNDWYVDALDVLPT